jgi:hypothetical protein
MAVGAHGTFQTPSIDQFILITAATWGAEGISSVHLIQDSLTVLFYALKLMKRQWQQNL